MLICPTCNGHFEARKYPWKGNPREVYCCATRRRKPGVCTNTLALPIAATDDEVLSVIEGEVLGTRVIEELLALVATGDVNESKHLEMDRDRLRAEVSLRVNSIASGVPPETVAPGIRAREAEMPSTKTELLDGLATLHMASPTGNSILWHVELAGKVHRSRAA